ncbi:MAG: prepilin peptidase [Elusimicrobia bacterium]|nr:prepilin peptidase [Elusimicrobiota bacterium]
MVFQDLLSFLWGLCLGSFANVLIHRVPQGQSWIRPRSHCPVCHIPIAFYDNIPILSFLRLQGLCRHCRAPIGWRYPTVELLCALATLWLWTQWTPRWGWILLSTTAMPLLLSLTAIDLKTFLLPDSLTWTLGALGLLAIPFSPILSGPLLPIQALQALWGGLAGWALMRFLAWIGERLFQKEALGAGDVKLMAAIGLWVGWKGVLVTLMLASCLGAFYGLILILGKKIHKRDPIPFGPFLALGFYFNLLFSPDRILRLFLINIFSP